MIPFVLVPSMALNCTGTNFKYVQKRCMSTLYNIMQINNVIHINNLSGNENT